MTPRLTSALDKCKISDQDAIHIITACIKAESLCIGDFVLSQLSIKRAWQKLRKEGKYNIQFTFFYLNLDFVVIYWDLKLLPDVTGEENVGRIPVVATAIGVKQLIAITRAY